jgi:O-antigen/teichoic acid export membrane protein
VLLSITLIGSLWVNSIFRVSPGFLGTAKWLFLIVGTSLALSLPLSVFSGVLQGLQSFHWLNIVQVVSNLVRAALIVVALDLGRGLIAIAIVTAGLPLVASGVYLFVVRRLIPFTFSRKLIDRNSLRQLFNYGAITFMIIVAERLRFQSDAMVIGVFLSASAITYFSIGSKLVDYANNVVDSMADTFMPMSSQFDATGDRGAMRQLFIAGNRACAMVMLPVCATLIIFGKSIIEAWVGAKYVPMSYTILVLLIVPRTVFRVQGASTRILFGMARHKPLAIAYLVEGVGNLVLSVLLIRRFGIVGFCKSASETSCVRLTCSRSCFAYPSWGPSS